MSLKLIAKNTLKILNDGFFVAPSGERFSLQPALADAIAQTRLHTPEQAARVLAARQPSKATTPRIEVTKETTQVAAHRLVVTESVSDLVLLNFASARNPGGGFINGAKAQEEDLSRCSALYRCLLTQPAYYEANRANSSPLYTNHIIYSPDVPWFRTGSYDEPNMLFLASIVTAPAPNAGVALRRDPKCRAAVEAVLRLRAGLVLAIMAAEGHRNLLLGAWGCGVFQNNPSFVADAFGSWLASEQFADAFDRVVFAIYDNSAGKVTLKAFQERFL